MQLGTQLLRPEVLPLFYLERGQRVDEGLAGLLPGLGRARLAHHLQRGRDEFRLAGYVCDQLAYIPRSAVGGPGPVLGLECVDSVSDALVLRLG
jgi:hypothetical protein